ncbi:MAG: asparagine synthase (glutamine-hydrolyzing) [Gemmatimonadota bacterium]
MCGIVGWLSFDDNRRVSPATVERMRDEVAHRGPDGAGLWMSERRDVGLGFRRLAIVDLNPLADQPMTNEDGRLWIVFNGEIYNHASIRPALERLGHKFRTDHSDTETLLHAFEEWGPACLDRLEGMFAFAVWNQETRELFMARDRIGKKPLYFTRTAHGFLFASEIKSLMVHPEVSFDVEPVALYHYLSFMTTPAPLTMFRGIYKMPAGHAATMGADGRFNAWRYWDAIANPAEQAEILGRTGAERENYCVSRTRTLLEEAVAKRTAADVPVGAFLSGGIDSSAIVALMSRQSAGPVRTFTVGFSDHQELNELDYARKVAKLYNCDYHEVLIDEDAMKRYLPDLVHAQDEPIADWVCIPLYFVSKLASDSGTIVLEVGEGADEQYCGYNGYMQHLDMYEKYWKRYAQLAKPARRAVSQAAEFASMMYTGRDRHLDIVVRAGRDREPFWSGANVFPEFRKRSFMHNREEMRSWLPESLLPASFGRYDSFEIVKSYFDRIDQVMPGSDVLTRMIYSEFKLRLPELLLMRVDKIGMSVSIEPRTPFLDHKLVEFSMGIPMEEKVRNGTTKSVLKKAVRGLIPDEIIDRRKMGFGAPMVEWLRGDFGRDVENAFHRTAFFDRVGIDRSEVMAMLQRHRDGRRDHATYVWLLYNAVAWYDHWSRDQRIAAVA